MTIDNDLKEILRVWGTCNEHKNLVMLVNNDISIKEYLHKVLENTSSRVPDLELNIRKSEQEMQNSTSENGKKSWKKFLEQDKELLAEAKKKIMFSKNELQKLEE